MSMNVDILNALYTSGVNTSSANSTNSKTSETNDASSFLKLLTSAIDGKTLGNVSQEINTDLLDKILGNIGEKDESKNNNLLASLMLLMQQGGINQNNIVDYESLINNLSNGSNAGDSTANSIIENLQSTNSYANNNLQSLLQGYQGQSLQQDSIESTNLTKNVISDVVTDNVVSTRIFPKDVMESINAIRQAHEQIRSHVDQIKNTISQQDVKYQDINISVVDSKNSNSNIVNTNNILNASNLDNISIDTLTNSNLISKESNIIVEAVDKNSEINKNIVNEELLKVNGVDITNNEKAIKISDESSLVRDSVMSQIKDQIVLMKADGKQTVTMQLTPENLGKLDIKMVFEKGNLSVEIMASNPKTHSLILSNISELKSVLQNSFTDRTNINADMPKHQYEQQHNQNNQGFDSRNSQQEKEQRQHQQVYSDVIEENDDVDFFTELTRFRDFRLSNISQF